MRHIRILAPALLGLGGVIAACGQVGADDGTPRLHPVEKACIEYELSGQMQSGTTVRCHRDYAYEQYEIQDITAGMMGITQETNQHVITIGDTIYSINLDTNTGTKTKNPMYEGLVSSLEDSSPEEMSATFLSAMGFTPTGDTMTILDETCQVYNSSMMGNACLTEDGLMLEQNFMGNVTRAVSVDRSTGGDDANYTLYENVTITDGPDLSNMPGGLQDLLGGMGNAN